jgi:hypothetical protein
VARESVSITLSDKNLVIIVKDKLSYRLISLL